MSQPVEPRHCPGCGALLGPRDRFCWHCGAGMRQHFPTANAGLTQPVVSTALLVLIAVILALVGSALTCGMAGGGSAGLGIPLGLAAAGVCVFAGWQMARRK